MVPIERDSELSFDKMCFNTQLLADQLSVISDCTVY